MAEPIRAEVVDFREKHRKWLEQDKIMLEKRNKLKNLDADWAMLVWRFNKSVIQPLEDAWKKLTPKEKEQF